VFPHLVRKLTSKITISFSPEGFVNFRENYIRPLQAMEEIGCTDITQLAACLALENLVQRMREEWTKDFKNPTKLPTHQDLAHFLEPLGNNLQALSLSEPATSHGTAIQHSARRPLSSGLRNSSSSACSICQEQHRLNRCPVFLGYDVTRRNKFARDRKLCINQLLDSGP